MKSQLVVCLSLAVFFYHMVGTAQANGNTPDSIDEFLKALPPESAWSAWLAENGPVYGNYCGAAHGDPTYEAPCLGRLDCICKAHDFGYSLRHYLETDRAFIEEVIGTPLTNKAQDAGYENFLQLLTAKLFAAKLKALDIGVQVTKAHQEYQKDPVKALGKLKEIIDENEIFRKKIEDINRERIKFEEQALEIKEMQETTWKSMAVSTQPFNIIAGLFSLNYEFRISEIVSLRAGVSFLGAGLITDTYLGYGNNKDFSAFFSLGLKNFILGETLKSGVYIEPFADVGYENVVNRVTPGASNIRDFAVVPALVFGAEKVFLSGIQIDIGLGMGMHLGIPVSAIPEGFKTLFLVPKFRASLGYAW